MHRDTIFRGVKTRLPRLSRYPQLRIGKDWNLKRCVCPRLCACQKGYHDVHQEIPLQATATTLTGAIKGFDFQRYTFVTGCTWSSLKWLSRAVTGFKMGPVKSGNTNAQMWPSSKSMMRNAMPRMGSSSGSTLKASMKGTKNACRLWKSCILHQSQRSQPINILNQPEINDIKWHKVHVGFKQTYFAYLLPTSLGDWFRQLFSSSVCLASASTNTNAGASQISRGGPSGWRMGKAQHDPREGLTSLSIVRISTEIFRILLEKPAMCQQKQTFTQHIVSLFLASPMWRSANLPPERLQIPHETCRWRSHPEPQVEDQIIEIPQIFKLKVHRLCIEETPDFPLSKLYANARCALQMLKRGSSNPPKTEIEGKMTK